VSLAWASCVCSTPDAPSYLALARKALAQSRPEEALAFYKRALDAAEIDLTEAAPVYRARALRGAADTYFLTMRDPRRAAQVYQELIERCPEAAETLDGRIHLASILEHHLQDKRGAIATLTAALARNPPQSAELSYKVASLYFQIADFQQSQLEAAAVAKRFETSAFVDDALYLRTQALAMDGKNAEAKKALTEFVAQFPDSPLRSHALVDLGALKAESGEREEAIVIWVEALKTHPKPEVVHASIARVRAQLRTTTPSGVGDASKAFDRPVSVPMVVAKKPKTSIEAVGGTQEEAEREAKMKGERVDAEPSAPAPPPSQSTPEAPKF
jgi:tetratricopeptide (TPR) repeat protein